MIRIFIKSEEEISASLIATLAASHEFEIVAEESVADFVLILRARRPNHNGAIELLTPREMEILRLIADGEGNKSIAYLLQISEHTVKFHISSIFQKLHVSSRTEAVNAGIKNGLISI
jgi:two-component system, NarL family, response regulator YdfI